MRALQAEHLVVLACPAASSWSPSTRPGAELARSWMLWTHGVADPEAVRRGELLDAGQLPPFEPKLRHPRVLASWTSWPSRALP